MCIVCEAPSSTKYCSTKCRLRSFPHDACQYCGHEFVGKQNAKFCSRQCNLRHKNIPGAEHSKKGAVIAAEIQKQKRGTGTSGWYIKEMGVHQHRTVAENMLGRLLLENEVVHHKDHNKKNNDPSNLEVLDRAEHARQHMLEYWERRKNNETL